MAHKKGVGSTKNGRDSESKRSFTRKAFSWALTPMGTQAMLTREKILCARRFPPSRRRQ